jgi:hypothetical protein
MDAHLGAFAGALDAGVAGVLAAHAISQAGPWSALGGLLDGATLEPVGASFNRRLLTNVLRTDLGHRGLVVAALGVLEDPGLSPLGAPWGLETSTRAERIGKAVGAGVDQLLGLDDPLALRAARDAGLLSGAQVDASARRALTLMFRLGLFEDPYVDAALAPSRCNADVADFQGRLAMSRGLVLLVNGPKPAGWLNGNGDGTQLGDPGNAGNGSGRVLPAPPGTPYGGGALFYAGGGNLDLDYVRSVSQGYGDLTNDLSIIGGVLTPTPADRMAAADYILLRVSAPCAVDPDSGPLQLCRPSLEYGSPENAAASAAWLQPIRDARAALDGHPGSKAQIIVAVDAARPPVVSEILALGVAGLYLDWGATDRAFLDTAFGIFDGQGRLPVGVPRSDAAAAAQLEDLAGDGQHATFVRGFGLQTRSFWH